MFQFYEEDHVCSIVIDNAFEVSDVERLEKLFDEKYMKWIVAFTTIDSLEGSLVELLYSEIFLKKKAIILHAHRERLTHYLHKLGFTTHAYIEEKKPIVDLQSIEIVLVGGSADSSQKIVEIVKNSTFESLSLVIVQHQQAKGIKSFDSILQSYTHRSVSYVKHLQKIEKGHIYLAPSDKHLLVEDGYFVLSDAPKYNFARPSISLSYDSFSGYYRKALLIIQECGYLHDGVDKLAMLKANGSKIIIQAKEECEAKSMVIAAQNEGSYDYILTILEIVEFIKILDQTYTKENYLQYLMQEIKRIYGYDFMEYQQDMLQRRFEAFMIKYRIKNIKNGMGAILFRKAAFKKLLLELSINVTEFFRNPKVYRVLDERLKSTFKNRKNLKVWSAGCSRGKEAVSLAILLDSLNKLDKSLIYATDLNKTVLQEAKNGLYSLDAYQKAEENLQESGLHVSLENYFVKNEHFVAVQDFIKEKILYFEHNLVTDSSFNEFDIIVCSNVLIYFQESLQKRVFQLLYDSLKFGGYLLLGEKELLHSDFHSRFENHDRDMQLYKKIG